MLAFTLVKFNSKFLLASYKKLTANNALKTSSVNLVHRRIRYDVFVNADNARNKAVHNPVHPYIPINGSDAASVNLYKDVMNANVKPVGPKNVIG